MRLGLRIHELLKDGQYKASELAASIGTKPSTVSGWKNNDKNPSSEMILPICEFFKITPTFLYTGKNVADTNLTSEENQILSLYNQLSYTDQRELLGIIKGFAVGRGINDMELQNPSGSYRREA